MTNKEARISLQKTICNPCKSACKSDRVACCDKCEINKAIEALEKQERFEVMKSEDEVIEYLSAYSRDTLIDLFLLMRFERDLYMELYESRRCGNCAYHDDGSHWCCERNLSTNDDMYCTDWSEEE